MIRLLLRPPASCVFFHLLLLLFFFLEICFHCRPASKIIIIIIKTNPQWALKRFYAPGSIWWSWICVYIFSSCSYFRESPSHCRAASPLSAQRSSPQPSYETRTKKKKKKEKERNSFEAHKDGRPVRAPLSLPLLDLLFSLSLCNVKTRLPRERAAGNLSSADKVAFNNTSLRFPSQNIKGGLRSPEPEPDQIQGQTSTQSRLEIFLSAANHHEVFDPHYLFIIHIKKCRKHKKNIYIKNGGKWHQTRKNVCKSHFMCQI